MILLSILALGTFAWPGGTSPGGDYPAASNAASYVVSAVDTNNPATENDVTTHKYRHHTRIAWQNGITWVAFSSAATNEADGGQQTAMCWSTNRGQTWSAPQQVCPSQSAWTLVQYANPSRITYPRNFQAYNGTVYLVVAVDEQDTLFSGAALFAREFKTNGTMGTLFKISPPGAAPGLPGGEYYVLDGKAIPSYDSSLGPPLYAYSKIYGCWGGSKPQAQMSDWPGFAFYWTYRQVEPNTCSADGTTNNLYRLWRQDAGTNLQVVAQATSTDGGATWPTLVPTTIPNTPAETVIRRLSDGRFCIIGNNTNATRNPLFLALTGSDSTTVTNVWDIRTGLANNPIIAGTAKQGGAAYPDVVQVGHYLYVSYSMEKETIGFTRLALPDMADDRNDVWPYAVTGTGSGRASGSGKVTKQ